MPASTPSTLRPPAFENDNQVEKPRSSESGIIRLDRTIVIPDYIKDLIHSVLSYNSSKVVVKPLLNKESNRNSGSVISASSYLDSNPIEVKDPYEVTFKGEYQYTRNENVTSHQGSWLAYTDGVVTRKQTGAEVKPGMRIVKRTIESDIFQPSLIINTGFTNTHYFRQGKNIFIPFVRLFTDSRDYENIYRDFINETKGSIKSKKTL